MPAFRYTALTSTGERRTGLTNAANHGGAVRALQMQGWFPLEVEELRPVSRDIPWRRQRRLAGKAVSSLICRMGDLLGSGLRVGEVLSILLDLAQSSTERALLERLNDRVRQGSSLADALAQEGGDLLPVANVVRSGEASGALAAAVRAQAEAMAKAETVRDAIRSAAVYPTIVMIIGLLSVAFILLVVMPRIEPLLSESADLPATTMALLWVSRLAGDHGATLMAGSLAAVLVVQQALRSERLSTRLDEWALRAPLLGQLARKVEAARLLRSLGTMLVQGVALADAVPVARRTLRNRAFARRAGTLSALREGRGLAELFADIGLFDRAVLQLVRVGEETGRLGDMLINAAILMEAEVQRMTQRAVALLVPAMTLALGALVALVVASIFSALLSISDVVT